MAAKVVPSAASLRCNAFGCRFNCSAMSSRVTLPLGTVEDVAREAREVAGYLGQDSGYIFCNIHNILAEIAPEKVIAMYRAAVGEA